MKNITTIFTHGKGELGIDNEGNLYWNKKLVVTKSKLSLEWWGKTSVIIGAISTLAIAVFTGLSFFGLGEINNETPINKNTEVSQRSCECLNPALSDYLSLKNLEMPDVFPVLFPDFLLCQDQPSHVPVSNHVQQKVFFKE